MLWKASSVTQLTRGNPNKRSLAGLLLGIFVLLKLRRTLRARLAASKDTSPSKAPQIPGYTPLSDQVYIREPAAASDLSFDEDDADAAGKKSAPGLTPHHSHPHPDVVILYGWGDGLPKHVAKYAEGFRAIFPRARVVLVLSPISRAMFTDLEQRTDFMVPIVRALFPRGPNANAKAGVTVPPRRILVHTMSNTGGVNYAATANAFRRLYGAAMPHQLLVMDSTPGGVVLDRENLVRWSRAMALGVAPWLPWPFFVTQGMFAVFLMISGAAEALRGRESAGKYSRRVTNDTDYEVREARKLYMYSKEDDLIRWEDIELHVAEARQKGWQADVETFRGSGHVGHMRMHTEQYWRAIQNCWEKSMDDQGEVAPDAETGVAAQTAA